MKTPIKNLFTRLGGASCAAWVLPALIAGLGLMPAGRVTAQTYTNLHSFTGGGSDGAGPQAGVILSGNTLYGTTHHGGSAGYGTVFAVNTDGTGFTNLHSFLNNPIDGANPEAGLILSGATLYGTAFGGGTLGNGAGTVFAINTNGTGFTNLYSFTGGNDGANPQAGLILSGNTLYGTAGMGGSSSRGSMFAINTNGTGFTTFYGFTATTYPSYTNSDGAHPQTGLILSGNTLYGTANQGGGANAGTVFAVNTNGTSFTNLHNFPATPPYPGPYTNSDGNYPQAGLILSGNTLYGTAYSGGGSGYGTVFAVHTNGTGFTNLHSFTYGDGANPQAGLILSGNILYGTAGHGGNSGVGTVFAVHTDGTGFTNLHSFTGGSGDGAGPYGGLILSGNTLYGTTYSGGSSGNGTVFSLTLGSVSAPPPLLTIISSGTNVVLTWPTAAAGFTLQSTTNLVSPAIWSTVSPAPVVVNGQNTVTNPISGTRKFFRLSQ
jgi:uncharacterized repeat protein (TIGR03803 family)